MKKPALLVALGMKPSRDDDEEEAPPSSKEGGESESRELVKELLAAIKADDVDGVEDALEAFVHKCFEEYEAAPHHEGEHY